MTVTRPQTLWLLLALIPIGILLYRRYRIGLRVIIVLAGERSREAAENSFLVKWFFGSLFLMLGLTSMVLAAAGLEWGQQSVEDDRRGLDVSLVMDLSNSMRATDIAESRLGASRTLALTILDSFPDARFSVIAFANAATTIVPMTEDRLSLRLGIANLDYRLISGGGSDLTAGLARALESFPETSSRQRVIVLFSDGEERARVEGEVIDRVRQRGIPIFAVGAGTALGSTIPLPGGGRLVDENGEPVVTRLGDDVLRLYAQLTGGDYFGLAEGVSGSEISTTISGRVSRRVREGFRLESVRRYRGFLLVGLLFLVLQQAVRMVKWRGMF